MANPMSIAGSMIIGLILILLWLPSIIYSELNNKGNRLETEKLKKDLDTSFLHIGRIKSADDNPIILNSQFGKAAISDSIYSKEILKKWTRKQRKVKDSEGRVRYHYYYDWSDYDINGDSSIKNFNVVNNDGKEVYVNSSDVSKLEINRISKLTPKDNININLGNRYVWENNFIVPNYPIYNYVKDITKKGVFYNVPNNTEVTVFAKNESLEKVDDETVSFLYPGKKTKLSIMKDRKSSNVIQRWVFRIGTFLVLFIGLNLLVSPLTHILNKTPEVMDFPIIRILKPFASAFSGIILFLWNTFSFLGSLILTAILTSIVYLLVNYTVIGGVSLGVLILVMLVLNVASK
jgi:hypothetical protein